VPRENEILMSGAIRRISRAASIPPGRQRYWRCSPRDSIQPPAKGLTWRTSISFTAKDREVDSIDCVTNGLYS
jgi:hypothetical protein